MGSFIKDSLDAIKFKMREKDNEGSLVPVIIRIRTASGELIRLRVVSVQDDYISALEKNQTEPEPYSFAHISNWRFAPYIESEWKK